MTCTLTVSLPMIRNDRGELPWQLALKVTAPVAVVMLLLPVPEHLTWANSDRELSPEAFADAICQRLTQLGQTQLLPHYRTLSNALRARRYQTVLHSFLKRQTMHTFCT